MANYIFRSKVDSAEFDLIINGQTISFEFECDKNSGFHVECEKDKYIYKNIKNGVDVAYYLDENIIKEYILIWSSSSIPDNIKFKVKSNDNLIFYITPDGEMQFRTNNGKHLLSFNKTTISDCNNKQIGEVNISHSFVNNEHYFTLYIDKDQYESKSIAYPIVIDPPMVFGKDVESRTNKPIIFSQIPYGGRVSGDEKFSISIYQDVGAYPVYTYQGTPVVGTVPLYPILTYNDAEKQSALINGLGMESWTITIEFICNKVLGIPGSAPKIYYSIDYITDVGVHSSNNETEFVGNIAGSSVYRGSFRVHRNSYPSYVDGVHTINVQRTQTETYSLPFQIYVEAPERATWYFTLRVGGAKLLSLSDPTTSDRNIANAPGAVYSLNSWDLASKHPATNSSTIVLSKTGWTFDTNATQIKARLYGGVTTSKILAQNTQTVSGNISNTTDGISIQVTNWSVSGSNYTGDITITYNLSTIASSSSDFTNGGRFYVDVTHYNGDLGEFIYSSRDSMSDDIFYDNSSSSQTISGLTIGPQMNVFTGKWLSGVLNYTLGDQVNILIADMDNLNSNSYPDDLVNISSSDYGISNYAITGPAMTGWQNDYNNTNASYNVGRQIDISNYCRIGSTTIGAQVSDWTLGAIDTDSDNSCINTYGDIGTAQREYFQDEKYRCIVGAQFDWQNARNAPYGFQGYQSLGPQDAQYVMGRAKYPSDNYSTYEPGKSFSVGNPNYTSGFQNKVFVYREFSHPLGAQSCNSGTLALTLDSGSEDVTDLMMKLAKPYDATATGGTQWVNLLTQYDDSNWNNGVGNQGCFSGAPIGAGGGNYTWTIGTNNLANISNGTVYVMVGMQIGTQISGMQMSFN